MLTCCEQTTVNFINEDITTIPWTLTTNPVVSVFYRNEDDTFTAAGVFTRIERTPTQIIIDHGGIYSGVVRILH